MFVSMTISSRRVPAVVVVVPQKRCGSRLHLASIYNSQEMSISSPSKLWAEGCKECSMGVLGPYLTKGPHISSLCEYYGPLLSMKSKAMVVARVVEVIGGYC
jgi:hypothetical protein